MPDSRHELWLKQAENDLAWGHNSLKNGFYAQSCFIAQQVGEKAIKALAYFRKIDIVKSHSITKIVIALKINGPLAEIARVLDLYYIPTRYPDAMIDNITPGEFFSKKQADEALAMAENFLKTIASMISST